MTLYMRARGFAFGNGTLKTLTGDPRIVKDARALWRSAGVPGMPESWLAALGRGPSDATNLV
jgi:hypothetical protein